VEDRPSSLLMKRMGIEALYRRPRTTKPEPGHKIYPYLLRGMEIVRPNQVWAMDITYIPMARGFVYLAVVLDWFSRRVLSWRASITMEAAFCVETLEDALARHGKPDIFNTDQGSQFTGSPSPVYSPPTALRSAWTAKGLGGTTVRRAPVAQHQIRGGVSKCIQGPVLRSTRSKHCRYHKFRSLSRSDISGISCRSDIRPREVYFVTQLGQYAHAQ
jgi:hypothetical protein